MMSIFSPFDAFCAESIATKLFNYSSSSVSQFDRRSSSAAAAAVDRDGDRCLRRETAAPVKKDAENSSKVTDGSGWQPMRTMKKMNPRFAVEVDGVHCFETILPY